MGADPAQPAQPDLSEAAKTFPTASLTRRARFVRVALLCMVLVIVGEWATIVAFATQLTPPHISDFGMYYAAATLLRHNPHGNIYSASALLHVTATYGGCPQLIPPQYVYPPLLAIALEPLTFLTCAQALVVWTLLNALLWALAVAMIADLLRATWATSRLGVWMLAITGAIAFWPAYPGLFLGQTHLLILFLLTAGIWMEERGRPWLAGAAIVCAAFIKPLPALLLLYYLMRGRWAVIGGALVAGLALLAVMLLDSSPATVAASLSAALASTAYQAHPGQDEALSIVAGPIGGALALAAAGAYILTLASRRRADIQLGAAWTLCSMLVFSPVVWSFYLVWLLPALAIALRAVTGPPRHRAALYGLIAVIYLTLALPFDLVARPFATLALWILCGALYWRSSASGRASAPTAVAMVSGRSAG